MVDLVAVQASPGLYVDSDWPCGTQSILSALDARDYLGLGRYVPLPGYENSTGDITSLELQSICARPTCNRVWLVQHPRNPGWDPTRENPELDAKVAVARARGVSYAQGAHLFVDLEGFGAEVTGPQVIAYAARWQHVVIAEGYRAGAYVGYAVRASASDLYELLPGDCYWSAFNLGAFVVAKRGYAIKQQSTITVAGVGFDPNRVAPDELGGMPWMCGPAPVLAAA